MDSSCKTLMLSLLGHAIFLYFPALPFKLSTYTFFMPVSPATLAAPKPFIISGKEHAERLLEQEPPSSVFHPINVSCLDSLQWPSYSAINQLYNHVFRFGIQKANYASTPKRWILVLSHYCRYNLLKSCHA